MILLLIGKCFELRDTFYKPISHLEFQEETQVIS